MHSSVEETIDIGNVTTVMEKLSMFKHILMEHMNPWKSPYMQSHPVPLVPDYKTRCIQIEVPLELSRNILKNVETKGVSLHAVWTAAAGIAMHEMLNLSEEIRLRSTHEADLRVLINNYDSKDCRSMV